MADSSSRTQITVAVIGLVGVLAAALIANRAQIQNTSGSSGSQHQVATVDSPPHAAVADSPRAAVARVDPPSPEQPRQLDTMVDDVRILKASPPSGSRLQQGQPADFDVLVEYNLTTMDTATLYVGLVQYRHAKGCVGRGDIPVAEKTAITRGMHTAKIPIRWNIGVSKDVTTDGSIGYEAMILNGEGVHTGSFPNLAGYCYSF